MSTGTPKIGFSSLLGGGLFVTTIVTAAVGLESHGHSQIVFRSFVRDVVFYAIAVMYLGFVIHDGMVYFSEALGFLGIYVVFVGVVFVQRQEGFAPPTPELRSPPEARGRPVLRTKLSSGSSIGPIDEERQSVDEELPLLMDLGITAYRQHRKYSAPTPKSSSSSMGVPKRSISLDHLRTLTFNETISRPVVFGLTARRWTRLYHHLDHIEEESSIEEEVRSYSDTDDSSMPWYRWMLLIEEWMIFLLAMFHQFLVYPIDVVLTIARRLTVPLVDIETWNIVFAVLNPPCICFMLCLDFGYAWTNWQMWLIVGLVGLLGSLLVGYTADPMTPPTGVALVIYLLVAFVMSIIWIMNIANEVLSLLEALGHLLGISDSILGITVLAWGNSIGDLVSDVSISRDGFPAMALAGCFAGPLFNLLVGLGLSLTLVTYKGTPVSLGGAPSTLVDVGFGFLLISLSLNLIVAGICRQEYSKPLCYTLIGLYLVFMITVFVVGSTTTIK